MIRKNISTKKRMKRSTEIKATRKYVKLSLAFYKMYYRRGKYAVGCEGIIKPDYANDEPDEKGWHENAQEDNLQLSF